MPNTAIRLLAVGSVTLLLIGCNDTNSIGDSASPSPVPATPNPAPSTPSPAPSTPSPSPAPSGSDSRTVGPDASAGQAADLSTPDNAAQFGGAFLSANEIASDDNSSKSTENCNAGGTRTTDSTNNGSNTKITYNLCRTRLDASLIEQDGVLSAATGGFSGSSIQTTVTLGEGGVSLSTDTLEPLAAQGKNLALGSIATTTTLSGQQFTPTRSESQIRLKGAQINTKRSDRPRIDFSVGSDATPYQVVLDNLDQPVIRSTFSGPAAVSGACGSGSATVSTPTPLETNKSTGATTAGQISVQSSSGSATYTYNSNGTVTISAGGSSKTYTQQELQALQACTAFN